MGGFDHQGESWIDAVAAVGPGLRDPRILATLRSSRNMAFSFLMRAVQLIRWPLPNSGAGNRDCNLGAVNGYMYRVAEITREKPL